MVKKVVEPMLDEGQPEQKLQEPYCYGWNGRMKNETMSRGGSPGCPYVEFGARDHYKEEVLPTEGSRA